MKNNPFASETYKNIWLKHYNDKNDAVEFDSIKNVSFVKQNGGKYVNVGKNFTNGMLYSVEPSAEDFKGKTFVVYDVPEYFKVQGPEKETALSVLKVRQYKGLYVDLTIYDKLEDVLPSRFKSSRSRYNFRNSIKKLEKNHEISQNVFFGDISKATYDYLIREFERILEERFDKISTHNTVLPMWDFYKEVLYPLILEKQVALNVIYDGDKPIALSFSFVYDDVFIVALRTFDINYSRQGIGNIEIYKLIDWSMDNGIRYLDFSKGESEYKERWCDVEYNYEHHILYDSKSIRARFSAHLTARKFKIKQYLRDKKINIMLTKVIYKLKNFNGKSK